MMQKMIPILTGHDLCMSGAERMEECAMCIQGKFIRHQSWWKFPIEMPAALYRLPRNGAALSFLNQGSSNTSLYSLMLQVDTSRCNFLHP